jgi:outer membrane receptor protein involved in Fe transport
VAEATARRTAGKRHALVYGGQARLTRFDLSLAPGEDRRREVGAFVEDAWAVGKDVTLNLGVRADHFDTVGLALSPRASVVWEPRTGQALRFAWSRAYRAPSLVNNYLDTVVPNVAVLPNGNDFVFPSYAKGNADLREEVVDAFEVGWTAMLPGRTTLTAAVYRNVTNDVIDFDVAEYYSAADPPPGLLPDDVPERQLVKTYSYRNAGRATDHGVEVSWQRQWTEALAITASATWQAPTRVRSVDPLQPLDTNVAPRLQGSFALWFLHGRWSGSFSTSYTGRAFWVDVLDERFWGTTDDFVLVDGGLGVDLWKRRAQLRLSATNLLDDSIKQHVFGDVIRRKAIVTATWRF